MNFVRERDPVVVVERYAKSAEILEVQRPWERGETYCLWNQTVLPRLERRFIKVEPETASYYGIDFSMPVIEFWYPSTVREPWNGREALTQGRVWADFRTSSKRFEQWYSALVRWIRKTFVRDRVVGDYIGPAAYQWFKEGGLLLPHFRPPVTSSWLSWVEAQDQHRNLFAN